MFHKIKNISQLHQRYIPSVTHLREESKFCKKERSVLMSGKILVKEEVGVLTGTRDEGKGDLTG